MSSEELYWFVCFNDDGQRGGAGASSGDHIKEALALTSGWEWGLKRIIESTPESQASLVVLQHTGNPLHTIALKTRFYRVLPKT